MKKIFISAFAVLAMLSMPQQAEGQAFLNKMKEKAQQAASNAASKVLEGTKAGEMMKSSKSSSNSSSSSSSSSSVSASYDDDEESISPVISSQNKEKAERKSTYVGSFDQSLVTPSTAKFPVPLMNELPAIPSVAEIANPTEAAQKNYYMAIQKVALRAEMLNNDETCDEKQEEMQEAALRKKLKESFGLTDRELDIMDGAEASEAEQKALASKLMGNIDLDELEKMANRFENMSEAEQEAEARKMFSQSMSGTTSAAASVYNKYPNEVKKYTGKSAAEMIKITDQSVTLAMQGKEKESEAISKKAEDEIKAYQKTLSPADQKAAKEFEAKAQKELQEAMKKSAMSNNPLGSLMAGMQERENKMQAINEWRKKYENYLNTINNATPKEPVIGADYKLAAADRKKVEELKAKIFATDDPAVYNPLYVQVDEIIKSYRTRAAQVWRSDVEKRFNAIKAAIPGVIKANRQAIEDGLIAECMLYRVPLNLVLGACEILESAYSELPADYPTLYKEEVAREVKIGKDEYLWWPEFYVANSLSNILAGKTLFKYSDGNIYQFNAGKWTVVNDKKLEDKTVAGEQKLKSQKWTSKDGKRTVTYIEEGGYFLLPEGDTITPDAIELQGNNLIWAEMRQANRPDGTAVIQIVKCTYKL